jgi:hypothetical protein
MAPVLQQSLHAVPIVIRIGYISTATYCLSLQPPLVTVKELLYLLRDAISDVSDASSHGRPSLIARFRVESIKLMSAVLASDDVRSRPVEFEELSRWRKCSCYVLSFVSFFCVAVGSASALKTFICVLYTLRTQISQSTCNFNTLQKTR